MIGKPDKGNGVVVMDRAEYATKMKVILNDQSKFKAVHKDNYLKNLVKFQRFLSRLKAKSAISPEKHLRIRPTAAATPTLYGLPKLHKENAPMRPIWSSIGSSNHECAAWLSKILTPLRHRQTTVKDISNLSASDKIMASLDVTSLFTNVPVNFTTDLVLKSVFSNNITEFHGLKNFN